MSRKQFVVVPVGEVNSSQFLGEVVLVDESGEPWSPGGGESLPVAWGDVTGKPATFPAAAHKHDAGDIDSGTLAAARIPTLSQSKVSGLEARLDAVEARIEALEGGVE